SKPWTGLIFEFPGRKVTMRKLLDDEVEVIKDPLGLRPDSTLMDFHEKVWRHPGLPISTRQRSGIALLQFLYPKLAVVGNVSGPDMAEKLDRAIARSDRAKRGEFVGNGGKLIEARPLRHL